jgi:predicted MFS family arabinose efflux permease
MCGFVMLESMGALFVSRADTFGWTPRGVGLYFGYLGLVIIIVQGGLIGRVTRRFGDWPPAVIGPIFVALGMANLVYMGYRPTLWLMFLGSTLSAAGRSLQTPTLFSLISKNASPREQGVVFGLNQGMSSMARAIGPAVGGLIYKFHPGGPFALASGLLTMACLWTLSLRRQSGSPAIAAAETA